MIIDLILKFIKINHSKFLKAFKLKYLFNSVIDLLEK